MRNIKSVLICFENTEVLDVAIEYIGMIEFSRIEQTKSMVKSTSSSGEMREVEYCGRFIMAIDRSFNEANNVFVTTWSEEKPLDRINSFTDITSMYIIFEDGTRQKYLPRWSGDDYDFNNELQKSKKNSFGDLFIEINDNREEEPYFRDDAIEYRGLFTNVLKFGDR